MLLKRREARPSGVRQRTVYMLASHVLRRWGAARTAQPQLPRRHLGRVDVLTEVLGGILHGGVGEQWRGGERLHALNQLVALAEVVAVVQPLARGGDGAEHEHVGKVQVGDGRRLVVQACHART